MSVIYLCGKKIPKEAWENLKEGVTCHSSKERRTRFSYQACFGGLPEELKDGDNLYLALEIDPIKRKSFEDFVNFFPNITIIDSCDCKQQGYGGKNPPNIFYFFVEITSNIEELKYRFYYLYYMGVLIRYFSEQQIPGDKEKNLEGLNFKDYINYIQDNNGYLGSGHLIDERGERLPEKLFDYLKYQEKFIMAVEKWESYASNKRTSWYTQTKTPLRQTAITIALRKELGEEEK